jgi:hypothetical protein
MEIRAWVDQVLKTVQNQRIMHKIGLAARFIIRDRTMQGKDIYGKSFQPYTRAYTRKRQRHNLSVHPVTLTWDPHSGMLKKIKHKVTDKFSSVRIYFTDSEKEQLARYHNYMGVAKKVQNLRKFWGFTEKEEREFYDAMGESLLDMMNGRNPDAINRLKNTIGDV